MIVNWKGERVLSIPVIYKNRNKDSSGKGKPVVSHVGAQTHVTLIPGYNDVDDAIWRRIQRHVQKYLDKGAMEIEFRKEVDEDSDSGQYEIIGVSIRRVKPKKALDMVRGCFNLDTLNLWQQGGRADYEVEVRDEIRAAIKDQIEKITAGTADSIGTVG